MYSSVAISGFLWAGWVTSILTTVIILNSFTTCSGASTSRYSVHSWIFTHSVCKRIQQFTYSLYIVLFLRMAVWNTCSVEYLIILRWAFGRSLERETSSITASESSSETCSLVLVLDIAEPATSISSSNISPSNNSSSPWTSISFLKLPVDNDFLRP